MIPFNKKKHSDITVTVSDGAEVDPKEQTFYLHKFPLVSKSHFFDDNIPDSAERPGSIEMHIKEFPGGPSAFESVAQWCYGIDIELTVDDIAPIYCGARFLHIADLEKTTDAFMTEIVLPNPRNAAKVLKVSTEIENMRDDMMEGLVGRCINAIASSFDCFEELNALPADCFACIVRNARDMDVSKDVLERAVTAFLKARLVDDTLQLSDSEFIEVVSATGRMDDMRHCDAVFSFLEVILRQLPDKDAIHAVCKALHDLGFWVSLPHSVIERAYTDRCVPDRYCTVALMAENRHLLKVNEQLAEQVESLSESLAQMGGLTEAHGAMSAMGMHRGVTAAAAASSASP